MFRFSSIHWGEVVNEREFPPHAVANEKTVPKQVKTPDIR